MDMLVTEFILFTVISAVNAYLPVFLQIQNYSATQIGYLYGIFNAFGIIVPLLLVPVMSRKGKYSFWLFIMAMLQLVVTVFIFRVNNFWYSAVFMALFAVTYRGQIPVSDSIITNSLGDRQDRYGMIRVSGTLGFIVMSLVMQKYLKTEGISVNEMTLWFAVPSALFVISLIVRKIILAAMGKRKPAEIKEAETEGSTVINPSEKNDERSTLEVLKGFDFEFYLMLFVIFMEFLGMVPSNQFISMYATSVLHKDIVGLLWAINAICEFPFMFVSSWFIKKFGERKLIIICTLAVTVRLLFYAFIPGVTGAVMGQCMHSLTYGLFFPACISYCSKAAKGSSKANLTGLTMLNVCTTLPAIIGAAFGGVIIDNLGYRPLFLIFALFPVIAAAVFAALRNVGKKKIKA